MPWCADEYDSFQFTPLREGRQRIQPDFRKRRIDFNSRPSARGDEILEAVHVVF